MGWRLNWKGEEVTQKVLDNVAKAMGEFALRAEGNSKRQLQKGHGVITGTLRRSIHLAHPGYNWAGDAEQVTITGKREKGASYTLGGKKIDAVVNGRRVSIQIGSGLHYALPVHQGHHGFAGYHYLTNGVDQAKSELPGVLEKYRLTK